MARFGMRMRSFGRTGGRGRGFLGRAFLALFGLAFVAAGVFAAYAMTRSVLAGLETRGWEETSCTVRESAVLEAAQGRPEPRFHVVYEWRYGGSRFTGDRVREGVESSPSTSDLYRLAWLYPAGATVPCRVDPEAPARAVLEAPGLASLFTLLVPLPFVAVGLLVLGFTFLRSDPAGHPRPVTFSRSEALRGTGCLVGFFLVFAVAGLGFLVPFFVLPATQAVASSQWMEVPATVVSSQVGVHSGDDGSTYSVDIVYAYEVDGRELRSDRYDFLAGSSSGYDGKAEIVARYPPGTRTVAYVDPEAPWSAVLSRSFRSEWLVALLPLVFVLVGLGGAGFVLAGHRRETAKREAGIESWLPDAAAELEAGALVLEPQASPLGKFLGLLLVAVFWNGIVGTFVYVWWQEARVGAADGCMTLFLIPFVLVGVLLLVTVPYQFLAMFNPRPILTLDRRRLEPGTEATLQWRFRGRGERIDHLKITFEGREEATYRRGTTTQTDRETFLEIVLADTSLETTRGSARLTIPADTMHSFEAGNNKVVWALKLHGAIARWPDVSDEFPLVVQPRSTAP